MGKKTPLFDVHQAAGARMVDFAGWDMPVQYTSLMEEHRSVRSSAGMFDVSHMLAVDITGSDSFSWLQTLLANNVDKISKTGKALYSCMLNERGGVIDDLIVYHAGENHYRMVINAGTRDKDLAWMTDHVKDADVLLKPRTELAIIAVQGPEAREKALAAIPQSLTAEAGALKRFFCAHADDWFVGRTGYTGEDGFEVMLPGEQASEFWNRLAASGVQPAGLGARDTLRLEAGMNLYGSDMDEDTSPLESGLAWTVAMEPADRDFIGREALQASLDQGLEKKLVGLVLEGKGVLRSHLPVHAGDKQVGETTSGTFAPSLSRSIAFARIDCDVKENCEVEIRSKRIAALITNPPFIKNGKANF